MNSKELLVRQRVRAPVLRPEALSWRYDRLTVHILPTMHSNTLLKIASGLPVSVSNELSHTCSFSTHFRRSVQPPSHPTLTRQSNRRCNLARYNILLTFS